MTSALRALLLTAWACALGDAAQAQLGATLSVDSDYRFRGVSISDSKPAWRFTVNHDFDAGAYAGASATRVELSRGDPYTQLVGYAGFVMRKGGGPDIEWGANYSHFTGDASYDFAELYAGLLGERWSVRAHYAPDYFGRRVQTLYLEANAFAPLDERTRVFVHGAALVPISGPVAGSTAGAAAGRTRFDLRAGAGIVLGELDVQLAWVGATSGGPYPAVYDRKRSAWVASVQWSF